jgi:phosphinothricin acetyltransferase
MHVRPSTEGDLGAIAMIYTHHVTHGLGSFETEAPSLEEIARRRRAVIDGDLPYLVADCDGGIAGFAYATPHRARPGYRNTVEDSVYVSPSYNRKGIGRALLSGVITTCETAGLRQMVAVIGDSGNDASVRLHSACGFTVVGTLTAVGLKHGRWVDTVIMQRALGDGARTLPG